MPAGSPACSCKGRASVSSATRALIAAFLFPYFGLALTLGGGILGAILLAFIGAVILLVIVRVFKQITA